MLQQKIQTIIVGVDFSAYSHVVADQAKLLSKLWKAKLVYVHAIQDPIEYAPALYYPFPNRLSNEFYQKEVMKIYKTGKNAEVIAVRGMPSASILETAGKYPHPMIIAGYKGVRPVAEFFFGSTAQSLALNAKIPVWIHRGNKTVKPEKVLIPHDLSLESSHSIDTVKELSLVAPMKCEVFFVQQRPYPVLDYTSYTLAEKHMLENSTAKVKDLKKKYPHVRFSASKGDITAKITKKSKKFDMMVVTHHNPAGFLNPSQTAALLKNVNKPTLIVH